MFYYQNHEILCLGFTLKRAQWNWF